ncbi:MAG: SDR family NAD(P)-dependent oxidoreductase [Terriglobales bacterium]
MNQAYALITGASRGIGAALAEALAAQGTNLILTARTRSDLEQQRERLRRPGLEIEILPADLANGGADEVLAAVAGHGWPVRLLVNNAGIGSLGEFASLDPERERGQVRLNLGATVALTRGLVPGMRAQGGGAIINVSSTAALQPVPYMATYAATKVFLLHFSLALHEELRASGIHVMALCPGPTRTGFFAAASIPEPPGMQSAQTVARLALRGLRRRQAMVICSPGGRVLDAVERLLPRGLVARVAGRAVRAWHQKKA